VSWEEFIPDTKAFLVCMRDNFTDEKFTLVVKGERDLSYLISSVAGFNRYLLISVDVILDYREFNEFMGDLRNNQKPNNLEFGKEVQE